jgi:hypothetical protein
MQRNIPRGGAMPHVFTYWICSAFRDSRDCDAARFLSNRKSSHALHSVAKFVNGELLTTVKLEPNDIRT